MRYKRKHEMLVTAEPEHRVAYIKMNPTAGPVVKTLVVGGENIFIDLDEGGHIIGIELLDHTLLPANIVVE